jgi:hypothetical protein
MISKACYWSVALAAGGLVACLRTTADEPAVERPAARQRPSAIAKKRRPDPTPTTGQAAQQLDDEQPLAAPATQKQAAAATQLPSRNLQRTLARQLRSRKAEIRAAAVARLLDFHTSESARFLLRHGLASDDADVRQATYRALVRLSETPEVADFLLGAVEKEIKRGEPAPATCTLLGVMLAAKDPEIERRALAAFDQAARQPKGGWPLLLTLTEALAVEADETSLTTLVKITKRPLFTERFAFRRSVVRAITRSRLPAAVGELVTLLANVTGEVRGDIVRHLSAVSGEKFGLDPAAWAAWWQAQSGELKDANARPPGSSMADVIKTKSTYYGMPIYAARVVFVIDTSGSMSGPRIFAAKRELASAIESLPDGVLFSVLSFDVIVSPWSEELLPASQANKQAATAWVLSRGLGPSTASYDALEAAFEFDTESIFFLTDGEPAGGRVTDPTQIVGLITTLNQGRKLTINTIGIGVGPAGPFNPFDNFLRLLAAGNYGEYRRVDQ